MRIGLARRGYSSTGGAENYLRRLADGLETAGHECVLFAGPEWPRAQWKGARFQPLEKARSPRAFADGVARLARAGGHCELLFSLERLWSCDCYRAGDGVHRAWLERRAHAEPAWRGLLRRWNPKHRQILALEKSLFAARGAKTVIANSHLVRDEIIKYYDYPLERISVVHNGLPAEYFNTVAAWQSPERRAIARENLGLRETDNAILFAGSGWERKGLRAALAAMEILAKTNLSPSPVLLVAGRGNPTKYRARLSSGTRKLVRFLGPVSKMPDCYAAADLFVLPTLYDPFSNACLEALAAGLPVITTRGNGFSEIIEPGKHGEVLDEQAADFDEILAGALEKWLALGHEPERRETCRQRAAAHTIAGNVSQTMAFLETSGLLREDSRRP